MYSSDSLLFLKIIFLILYWLLLVWRYPVGTAFTAWLVQPLLDKIFIAKDREMLQLLPYVIIVVYALKEAGR